jgi:phospholipid/cholesterol/gamma-HCH transport system substrate-binding protein
MEIRASYMIVGATVLALIAGLAAFSAWLVKSDIDEQATAYAIYFEGSVTGLQEGSQVQYRGIPVGRIVEIGIDPENVERVRAVAEIDDDIPITRDTIATLEMQGITGIAYVQLLGGTRESAPLVVDDDSEMPVIAARRSALERVFESTPDLLVQAVDVADRLSTFLNDDNLESLASTLGSLETFSGTLADNSGGFGEVMTGLTETLDEIKQLSADFRQVSSKLDQRLDGVGGDLVNTLDDLSSAAVNLGGAARQLDGMVEDLREPLSDFSGTGLYELTNLVGESRALVAALTRITKEVERDPAGFLIGGSRRGFKAE